MTAQRNGFERTYADQKRSQPTAGSAQSAETGSVSMSRHIMPSGCDAKIAGSALRPCAPAQSVTMRRNSTYAAVETTNAITGATTIADSAFEATVAVSLTGSDFQKSTLRSRRSS